MTMNRYDALRLWLTRVDIQELNGFLDDIKLTRAHKVEIIMDRATPTQLEGLIKTMNAETEDEHVSKDSEIHSRFER